MYYSDDNDKNTIQKWYQEHPRMFASDDSRKRIYCNGKPTSCRHWRMSREHHMNMAFKWARSCEYLFTTLPNNYQIVKGYIKYPKATPEQWAKFKRLFRQKIVRYSQNNNCELAMCCKQHITYDNDFHYDFVGFTSSNISEHKLKQLFLKWIFECGGKRGKGGSSIKFITAENSVENVCNYCFKYPDTPEQQKRFRQLFPLPATLFHVTWVINDFWRCEPKRVTTTKIWNGLSKTETTEYKMSRLEQVWRSWITANLSDGTIPEFTEYDYRQYLKLEKIIPQIVHEDQKIVRSMSQDEWFDSMNKGVGKGGDGFRCLCVDGGQLVETKFIRWLYIFDDRQINEISELIKLPERNKEDVPFLPNDKKKPTAGASDLWFTSLPA